MVGTVAYELGEAAGYARAEAENRKAFGAMASRVRTAKTRRDVDEWQSASIAGHPCGLKCGRCSMCIRADAVKRNGADYKGGPVAWGDE